MARNWSRRSPSGPAADRGGQAHGPASSWFDLGEIALKFWHSEGLRDTVQLWAGAKDAVDLPVTIRVRAATALDPFRP
jgi:hypothetical protein